MNAQLFAIRDIKAGLYGAPMLKINHAIMERDMTAIASDPNHPVGKYPEDHDLYYLGSYNDETGQMDLLANPKHLGNGLSYVKKLS